MHDAVRTVLIDCLGVAAEENVLVLTDPPSRVIAEALVAAARELGAEVVMIEMSERVTHGSEPPPAASAAMLECDVLVAPTRKSVSHTAARQAATAKGARTATMPGITEDMLVRTMTADYGEVRRRSRALAARLTDGSKVRITSPAGTDVILGIEGRSGIPDDGDLRATGAFGNLPAGEGFIAPVEGTATGRLVIDGSIWPLGRLETPVVIELADGYAVDISGQRADEFTAILEPHGRAAFAVAELGIGTNEKATLTGNILEDEKILGTIHVALGDNHTIGGTNRVSSHQDGVVLDPSVTIDDEAVLTAGSLLL